MEQEWVEIPDYPGYLISNLGVVYSERRRATLGHSSNQRGIYQVGMMQNGVQRKVSVAYLVAEAFLPPPKNPRYNTVIHLDGNRFHNHADNLAWRPDGFARDYRKQFAKPYPNRINKEIYIESSGETFPDSWAPCPKYGILERAVVMSAMNLEVPTYVFPINERFMISGVRY